MDKIIIPPDQSNSSETGVTNKALRALIADDSENDVLLLLRVLRKAGYEPVYERVCTALAMKAALQRQAWDIVISDYEMPNFGGFEALQLLKESGHDLPFILVSAVISEETAVAAMKAGAHDYIMKRNLARLAPAIERELREAQTRVARKDAEAALRQSEEQLRQVQKIEAVGRLAAGVAHDFNNILTAIMGHSELLLRQLDADDPRRKNAEQIEKVAHLAAGLTRQLLIFSRKQVIEPRVLNLNAVILDIKKMFRRLIGEDIEFCTLLDPAAGHIKADPGQIEQVIMNLAVNARDAMPNGGKLTVTTANTTLDKNHLKNFPDMGAGDYVMLAIADTGTGMSEEVKAHLFEPFFTTKPSGKGTGLGLATCFGIVKQNTGHIDVQSELGSGTTFKIYFPQVQSALEPARVRNLPTEVAGGNETVLLVEDEPVVRELAVATLREKGYTVVEAVNGEEGLRLARQHDGKIDLVLTDVVMPVMGGKEMADALRTSHPDTKVLFTSGYTEDALGHHGVLRPGILFLPKPYMTATLARKVREILDEGLIQSR
ncbi:MAG: response regulator [Verrucomicrobiota bacterium]|jgi:signal transduction histidine kinase